MAGAASGSSYIAPNGDTQVRDCAEARQLRLPQCRPVTGPSAEPNTKTG
jgi:hypothetical protein